MDILGGVLAIIPNFDVGVEGFGGSPAATVNIGGSNFSKALELSARSMYQTSTIVDKTASIASIVAGYVRRQDEWEFQKNLAVIEIAQMERQIAAAELRLSITQKEIDNQVIQIDNAKATDGFMRSKYTNVELYQWQVGQVSGVYFQSYKLAYDLAKRAERCMRFEIGLQDSSYINFGYWDSLKKGLLSGEKLQYDLRRLEAAYIEQNRREFELTKHVSLALLDPLALVRLRETGRCFFNLPEELFDLDFPGHYFRRIKSVSLTLPCVVGPYTTISCTLRLLKNTVRINTGNGESGQYARNVDGDGMPSDDPRFVESNIPVKAIAVSNSQNDSGVFELSFRDERYLPFEGAGVISDWLLELFNSSAPDLGKALRQFDYSTISDAILHIKYTAREDVGPFKNGATAHLEEYFTPEAGTPMFRMFDLRREFPAQWQRFVKPINPAAGNLFELEIVPSLFPFRDQGKTLQVNRLTMLARYATTGPYQLTVTPPPPAPAVTKPFAAGEYGGLLVAPNDVDLKVDLAGAPVKWEIEVRGPSGNLQQDEVGDALLVLGYEWI